MLSIVAKLAGNGAGDSFIKVGVVKDNVRGFAAKFEGHFGKVLFDVVQHVPRRIWPAGERYPGDQRMAGQRFATGVRVAGDDVNDAVRNARLSDQLTEFEKGS